MPQPRFRQDNICVVSLSRRPIDGQLGLLLFFSFVLYVLAPGSASHRLRAAPGESAGGLQPASTCATVPVTKHRPVTQFWGLHRQWLPGPQGPTGTVLAGRAALLSW
jgi:hypothetical protein